MFSEPRSEDERKRRLRAFLRKLRADLVFLGADPYVVDRMSAAQLLEQRARRVRALMESAPRGAKWDG